MGDVVRLGRALSISGVLGMVAILAIPVGMALPGSVLGEAVSVAWLLSLGPVALSIHRVVGPSARTASALALTVGLVGITIQTFVSFAVVLALAGPLEYVAIGSAAYALAGAWLVGANAQLTAARIISPSLGWLGAVVGAIQLASYVLLLVGGFPTSTDPAAMASFHPATLFASILGLLSLPAYAGWAIWSGRRLSSADLAATGS